MRKQQLQTNINSILTNLAMRIVETILKETCKTVPTDYRDVLILYTHLYLTGAIDVFG